MLRKILGSVAIIAFVGLLPNIALAQGVGTISPRPGSSGGGVTPATLSDSLYCPDSGANDTYVCSMASAPAALTAGIFVGLRPNTANTGTATVDVNGLGAATITRRDDSTLQTGDLVAGQVAILEYDGNTWRMTDWFTTGLTYSAGVLGVSTSIFAGAAVSGEEISASGTGEQGFNANTTDASNLGKIRASYNTTTVINDLYATGTSVGGTLFGIARAGMANLYAQGSGLTSLAIGTGTDDPMYFGTNNVVAMTIAAGTSQAVTFAKSPVWASTIPAVSNTSADSCGTTAATIAGTSETGIITVGATAGTSCTLTFPVAAPTRRQCMANNETTANLARTTASSTTVTVVAGTFVAGDVIAYVCQVY